MDLEFTQFSFGKIERPPYTKFNNLLYVMEKMRSLLGPHSATLLATGVNLAPASVQIMLKDPGGLGYGLGGYQLSGGNYYLARKFGIEYENGTHVVRWEYIEFPWIDNTGWVATLGTVNIAYATKGETLKNLTLGAGASDVSLSGSTIANYTVFSMMDQ